MFLLDLLQHHPLLAIILALGLCRATQVVLHDRIFDRPRRWLKGEPKLKHEEFYKTAMARYAGGLAAGRSVAEPIKPPHRRKPLGELVAYLVGCPWCVSLELGLLIVVLMSNRATYSVTIVVLVACALSLLAVLVDRMFDKWFPDDPPNVQPAIRPAPMVPPPAVAQALDAAQHRD